MWIVDGPLICIVNSPLINVNFRQPQLLNLHKQQYDESRNNILKLKFTKFIVHNKHVPKDL